MKLKLKASDDQPLPPFAADHEDNPFEHREAMRVAARSSTRAATYEIYIQLSDNEFLRGTFKPMQGFYDSNTPRKTLKSVFAKVIDSKGNPIKRK